MPQVAPRAFRRVLEHLALVTIYSDTGLPVEIIPRLMGVPESADLTLSELLGPGPSRLLGSTNSGRSASAQQHKGVIVSYNASLHTGVILGERGGRYLFESRAAINGLDSEILYPHRYVEFEADGKNATTVSLLPMPAREEFIQMLKNRIWETLRSGTVRKRWRTLAALERLMRLSLPYDGLFSDAIGVPFREIVDSVSDIGIETRGGREFVEIRGRSDFRFVDQGGDVTRTVRAIPTSDASVPGKTSVFQLVEALEQILKESGPRNLWDLALEMDRRLGITQQTFEALGLSGFSHFVRTTQGFLVGPDMTVSRVGAATQSRLATKQIPVVVKKIPHGASRLADDSLIMVFRAAVWEHLWQADGRKM
jgi:hypothetical protein